jgi:hypothetical protein
MATRNLVPRNSGEGGVGKPTKPWATGYFDNFYISGLSISMDQNVKTTDNVIFASGNFTHALTLSGIDVATILNTSQEILQESVEFVFFTDAISNSGVSQKDFYETPDPELYLSGVTVAGAEDMRVTLQWDGPNDEYMGKAYIQGQEIPFENIRQLGEDTRRFEGYIDNLNITGSPFITGEANGRISLMRLTEVGYGPIPTNISIDEISNATPKPGEFLGTTHLKQGDTINIYVDFNRDDIQSIKVHDYGLAEEIDFASYTLEDLSGIYRATIPVTVSNRNGEQSVLVQAVDNFGSTGELKESSDFIHSSGTRDLDQVYPNILATDPASYNGRSDGLREGESTTFSNNISNWTNGIDYIEYNELSPNISIESPELFELSKTVHYETGIFSNEDNLEIFVVKTGNGSTDRDFVNIKIANGPVIVNTSMNSLASSAESPHITGSSQVKDGDTVDSTIQVDGKGVSINNIQISVSNNGISDGSQTSFSSNYTKRTLSNGHFEFDVPLKVFGPLGLNSRDGDQPATFTLRNNFGTLSDPVTTTDTAEVHNQTFPSIDIPTISYPPNQDAIKNTEFAEVENLINNFDEVEYTSPNNQLSIDNSNTFEGLKTSRYSSGDYNIDIDGGQNNFKITATRTANGAVTEDFTVVNIANAPLTISINNLASKLKTSISATSDNFNLSTSQLMLNAPTLSIDPAQTNPSSLTQTASGVGKFSNAYRITVEDADTKGTFSWQVSAFNLAGIETTTILSGPTYTLEGFTARTINCSPTSIGAGLASIGTTVTVGSNVVFENLSEGGSAPNGGTLYTFQNLGDGIQLDNSLDINNKFTVCDSNGVTNSQGDHVFNNYPCSIYYIRII